MSNRKSINGLSNPYLDAVKRLKKSLVNWDDFFKSDNYDASDWARLDVLGLPLCSKYSWAIPDERSLKILLEFSPLIEIGV
jgi:hypothetical protein